MPRNKFTVFSRTVSCPIFKNCFGSFPSKRLLLPAAGMITAGKFLEHFTGGEYPWVHFDIAGPAYLKVANGYRTKEGTGVGVRLMFDFLKKYNS